MLGAFRIISIPIAIWGFFAIPDLPHTTRAFYWTKDVSRLGSFYYVLRG